MYSCPMVGLCTVSRLIMMLSQPVFEVNESTMSIDSLYILSRRSCLFGLYVLRVYQSQLLQFCWFFGSGCCCFRHILCLIFWRLPWKCRQNSSHILFRSTWCQFCKLVLCN